jgi:endonuclease III
LAWRDSLARGTRDGFKRRSEAEAHVDRFAQTVLQVASRLAVDYGTPDLGNKSDPVDELVYIVLSRRTRERAYQAAYSALKARYSTWEEVAAAPIEEIEGVIESSGFAKRKSRALKGALAALLDRFGSCTLDPTADWTDEDVRAFLCTLPEVGPKSAACVMTYALDRPAFPVDAHVGRVLERLAILRAVGVELAGTDHKYKQAAAWDVVPPSLRYSLHINLLVHGRGVCLATRPRCGSCQLADMCTHVRSQDNRSRSGC